MDLDFLPKVSKSGLKSMSKSNSGWTTKEHMNKCIQKEKPYVYYTKYDEIWSCEDKVCKDWSHLNLKEWMEYNRNYHNH